MYRHLRFTVSIQASKPGAATLFPMSGWVQILACQALLDDEIGVFLLAYPPFSPGRGILGGGVAGSFAARHTPAFSPPSSPLAGEKGAGG